MIRNTVVFAALLLAGSHTAYAETTKQPNVLFIAMDDLNDWIGCMGGHPQARTPNLDRLAASGMLFSSAYCAGASCNPSRSALMSGIPPHLSGLYKNTQKMREVMPDAELIPKYFSRNGYWSAGSGKILHYFIDADSWDDYFPDKTKENPFPRTFYPQTRPVNLPREPWMYVETDWAALDVTNEEYGGDYLVADWISKQLDREHNKPFFLACGFYRPHEPWFVPKQYYDAFPLDTIQLPPGVKEGDLDDVPKLGKAIARNRYLEHIQKHGQWEKGVQAYLAAIAFADDMLGRVLDALDASPYRDNTIVVLWSDHGWHLGEKEHWQKYTGWRVCARVPLIIRVPEKTPGLQSGTKAGQICERPVNLVDLYKTLIDLCGLPPKEDIYGHSLVPLLNNPKTTWPHTSLTHLGNPGDYAISGEHWRYIHYRDDSEELYHIKTDPYEWSNLANNPRYLKQLTTLRGMAPLSIKDIEATLINPLFAAPQISLKWHTAEELPCPPSKQSTVASPLKETMLWINNDSSRSVKLYWVKSDGSQSLYFELLAGEKRRQQSYVGHSWLVKDRNNDIGYFIAVEQPANIIIPAN